MRTRVLRYSDPEELAGQVAGRLVGTLVDLQRRQPLAQVCLSGGRMMNVVLRRLGALVSQSSMDPARLDLWWADERYLTTEDGTRHVGQALSLLAGFFPLDPARTHPMPALTGNTDVDDAARLYATELGTTKFDVTLLGVGAMGQVASLYPDNATLELKTTTVAGVHDAPVSPEARITLTVPAINRSREVWLMAAGREEADAVRDSLAADSRLPAGLISGQQRTLWFVDEEAAAHLPRYHCDW